MAPSMSPSDPSPLPAETDVVIVGGGPAGAAVGLALARLSIRTQILERLPFPRFRIGESQPPKVIPLLQFLGVLEQVDAAGFVRMDGNTVRWGGPPRVEPFDAEGRSQGYQLDRARFDRILLETAAGSGCQVVHGARVVGVERAGDAVVGARVRVGHAPALAVSSRFVVDATGPAGVLARPLGRRRREPVRTVGIFGYWEDGGTPEGWNPGNTIFEACRAGWVWSLLLDDGRRNVTCGVDVSALEGRTPAAVYDELLAETEIVAPLLTGARCVQGPTAVDATWHRVERANGPGFCIVGDAASFIDPLTSQGVVKALESGLLAAATINTAIRRPEDDALARRFHDESERHAFERYAAAALQFYRTSPHPEEPFWRDRVRPELDGALDPTPSTEEVEAGAARRRRLLEGVQAGTVRLTARPGLRIEDRARVERGFVVARPAVCGPGEAGADARGRHYPCALDALLPLLDGRAFHALVEGYASATGVARTPENGQALVRSLAGMIVDDLIEIV